MNFDKDILESIYYGVIDIYILQLLSKEDMYGYMIRNELEKRTNGQMNLKEGALYSPLYRLERKKLIKPRQVQVGKRRVRVYYSIEPLGKQYLTSAIDKTRDFIFSFEKFINWKEESNSE